MSDASFEDIPKEIQIEILSRLPPFKSLSRCKRVSKHWNDTLTIQAFLVSHSRSYYKHSKLGFALLSSIWGEKSVISFELNDDNTPKTTSSDLISGEDVYFTDFPESNSFHMSNICNDLICLFNPSSTSVGLLNLKTRDFIQLPAITTNCISAFILSWYALGFDPVHKVFKVLSISFRSSSKERTTNSKVAILTVGSKYWRPIDNKRLPLSVVEKLPSSITTNSLCLDGVIYYVQKNMVNTKVCVLIVFAFDLNREAFRYNKLVTSPMKDGTFRYYLTSLKECPITLLIWKTKSDDTEELERWTLFNRKNPNASWKRRNFTNRNFPVTVPHSSYGIPVAGGSTLLHYSEWINSHCDYLSYDLENFVI